MAWKTLAPSPITTGTCHEIPPGLAELGPRRMKLCFWLSLPPFPGLQPVPLLPLPVQAAPTLIDIKGFLGPVLSEHACSLQA